MYLNYNLKTGKERLSYIDELLLKSDNNLSAKNKKYIADYLLFITEKNQTKKEKLEPYSIITKNREATIDKRQISLEHITSSLENGEDGLYALINIDKNQFLDNKDKITQEDIDEIPGIKAQYENIMALKESLKKAQGKKKFALKTQIIDAWKQIYTLKAASHGSAAKAHPAANFNATNTPIPEEITINKDGSLTVDSPASLLKAEHVSFLLTYYSQLKRDTYEDLFCDMRWLLIDLENLIDKTFQPNTIYYDLIIWKIDGITNADIQERMKIKYGINHNEQYYSTLWKKRIPKLLSEQAQKDYLIWYYSTQEYGKWKYCRKCGEYKLAHPMFFSKNTSKSGWYSVCKDCRKKKRLGYIN